MREDWEYRKLGEVATYINGYAFKPEQWEDNGLPIIRIQNLNNEANSFNYYSGQLPEQFIVKRGDILISWSASLGVYEWFGDDAYLNQHIFKVVFDKSSINKYYLKYCVESCLSEMKKKVHGATMQHITKKDFDNVVIPVPPREEQERIVSELDLLSGILEKEKAEVKELERLAESIFYDMFGDPVENEKGYDVCKLENVFSLITDGTHQTPTYTDDINNGVKFLSAKDVTSGSINWNKVKYIPYELHCELYKRLKPQRNDILLCKNGTTGIAALVETDEIFDIYVSLALLRPNNGYNVKYLVSAINQPSTKAQFDASLKGIGVPNLHLGEIKKVKIIIPPLSLQGEFAERIERIEEEKGRIRRAIEETGRLFDYTMERYFG